VNLKEIHDVLDRVTADLAAHDSAMQAMDYPRIPDSVWRDLAAAMQAAYDDGIDPDRFRELNFEEYHYAPEYEEDDPDDTRGEAEES
jgi:hypothetical protein